MADPGTAVAVEEVGEGRPLVLGTAEEVGGHLGTAVAVEGEEDPPGTAVVVADLGTAVAVVAEEARLGTAVEGADLGTAVAEEAGAAPGTAVAVGTAAAVDTAGG